MREGERRRRQRRARESNARACLGTGGNKGCKCIPGYIRNHTQGGVLISWHNYRSLFVLIGLLAVLPERRLQFLGC